jgi:hypothetical protein
MQLRVYSSAVERDQSGKGKAHDVGTLQLRRKIVGYKQGPGCTLKRRREDTV